QPKESSYIQMQQLLSMSSQLIKQAFAIIKNKRMYVDKFYKKNSPANTSLLPASGFQPSQFAMTCCFRPCRVLYASFVLLTGRCPALML
ncbi:MAG: hypothetical protein LBP85_09220, partial [Prevotellaceae bacterium]|nr:hypothetical protein [Prevotellaceae bacterium]